MKVNTDLKGKVGTELINYSLVPCVYIKGGGIFFLAKKKLLFVKNQQS